MRPYASLLISGVLSSLLSLGALWPGPMAPTLRMSMVSRLAYAARQGGALVTPPPIFSNCTAVLDPKVRSGPGRS